MKKIILTLSISVCIKSLIIAQPYIITASNEIELQNKSYADNILMVDKENVCMVSTKNSGFMGIVSPSVENTTYNFFNNNKATKSVALKPASEDARYLESYVNNNKLGYFDVVFNKATDKLESNYRTVDNNGNVTKSTLVCSVDGAKMYLRAPEYIFKSWQSPNKKKVLLMSIFKGDKKDVDYTIGYHEQFSAILKCNSMKIGVVDENGALLYKKDISISVPVGCEKVSIEDYEVSDDGDVFLLVKQYLDGKKEKKEGVANYKLYIQAITNKGTGSKKIPINIKKYFSPDPKLVVSNKGNIYAGGLLSEKNGGQFVGIYTLKLSASTDSFNYKISYINTDEINKHNSYIKYKDDELSKFFELDRIVETDNGIGVVSQYFNLVVTTSAKGVTTYTYIYRDIVYYSFDNNMNLKDITIIPKVQKGASPTYFSYALAMHNDKPYFIFNDNKNNADNNEDEKMKGVTTFKNMAPVIVYHDGKEWIRKKLFEKDEVEGNILRATQIKQLDNNTIFLPFTKKGNHVLGKLTFID